MADLTITLTISDTDQTVLKNDLLSIDDWVQDAMAGKISNCWKRMQTEWTQTLMNDDSFSDPIPSNRADFVALVTSRPNYLNRADRQAAEEAEMAERMQAEAEQAAAEQAAAEQATADQAAAEQAAAEQAAAE